VPEIQAQADVMVLPLKRGAALSSVPSKLIAYLFSKKPVIACAEETSDTSLAIKRAGCGWVQPPENMEQLVNAFQKAISLSKNDLESYGINGFNYAVDNYSQQVNLLKFVHVVREVAGTA
jgi:glycosyltransferase involved in cell wall biosynthesis